MCDSAYTLHVRGSGSYQSWVRTTQGVTKVLFRRICLENRATEGESPVVEKKYSPGNHPSSARHEKPGVNRGGPPPKAKYPLATDSEQVRRLKNEKNPVEGSEIEPETIYLQAVGAL